MNLDDIKNDWIRLIAMNELDQLFNELNNRLNTSVSTYNDFIILYNQYSNLKRQRILSTLAASDVHLINDMNERTLRFVSNLNELDVQEFENLRTLFGTEWELIDYFNWLQRKVNFYKISFILRNRNEQFNGCDYSSITRIISLSIGSRYYEDDTLFISALEYSFGFNDPLRDLYDKGLLIKSEVNYKQVSWVIFIPLDIVSEIRFVDGTGDDDFLTVSPQSTYLLQIYTKGKHIDYSGILVDVAAITFLDRELCIKTLNVLQYIINNRKSYLFNETDGRPILPN